MLRYLVENHGRLVPKDELVRAVWREAVGTDESLTQCISEVRAAIGDQDQKLIKTVPRRGYLFAASVTRRDSVQPVDWARAAVGGQRALTERASVAVLPFTNLSGDSDQEYFCDGVTEDVITELSRFSELLVIARNSSFQYKGKALDVRQIGRELGTRYLLEGSIQRAGDRVRITAQLVDTTTGAHRWAERYDRELTDVFAVQDDVARTVAATLVAHVSKAETERTLLKPPEGWHAYETYLMAVANFSSWWSRRTATDLYEIRRLLERSLAIDPSYARAYAMLSLTYSMAFGQSVDDDYRNPEAINRALQLARTAIQLDPNLPQAHADHGTALSFAGQNDAAIAAHERAIALNPNFTDWRFGAALVRGGQHERAIRLLEAHMRIDPFYAPTAASLLGWAKYMLKQYAEALPPLQECVSRAPNHRHGHLRLAAVHAQLGRMEDARSEAAQVLRIEPDFRVDGAGRYWALLYRRPEDAEHFLEGLRKAGLPE